MSLKLKPSACNLPHIQKNCEAATISITQRAWLHFCNITLTIYDIFVIVFLSIILVLFPRKIFTKFFNLFSCNDNGPLYLNYYILTPTATGPRKA